jgi:cysteine dioxygenase
MMHTQQTSARDFLFAPTSPFGRLIGGLARVDFATADGKTVRAMLDEIRFDDASLTRFTNFLPGRHSRNGVYRNPRFELIVMCWPADVHSAVHEHGGSRGFVKVERGSLVAENYTVVESEQQAGYARLAFDGRRVLEAGDIEVTAPGQDVHRVGAVGQDAVSLHLYAKPLDTFFVFDESSRTCREVTSRYDTMPYMEIL